MITSRRDEASTAVLPSSPESASDLEKLAQPVAKSSTRASALSSDPPHETHPPDSPHSPPPPPPPPPPDGGFRAWLQVAGGFVTCFNSWGIINSFGVFQSYYERVLIPNSSPSRIAWIGSFQACLLFLVCIVVGPVFDKGYCRTLLATGTFLIPFGLMMTSLATQYYQLFLAQGLIVGCGLATIFLPSIAIVSTYFSKRRNLATGITLGGVSVGAVVFPIMFRQLIDRIGFGWTTRTMAFIVFGTQFFALATLKTRLPPLAKARALLDSSALRDPSFVIYCAANLCMFFGLYIPYFFLPTFYSVYLGRSDSLDFYIVSVLSAASLLGRFGIGAVADRLGCINTTVPASIVTAATAFAWIAVRDLPGVLVFTVVYGIFSGIMVALPLAMCTQLAPDLGVVGTRLGMTFGAAAIGVLVGEPIAGALLDLEKAVFWKAQLFCAMSVTVSTFLFMLLRVVEGRKRGGWKM